MEYVGLVVNPAIRVLKVLHEEAEKHRGIKNKITTGVLSLKNEMDLIGEEITRNEEHVLQELAYDIEDFLSRLVKPGALKFILVPLGMNPDADEVAVIEHFKDRINQVRNWQQRQRGEAGGAFRENRDTHELVGEAKGEFLKLLLAANDGQLRVFSIVGCSGLGKTALARALFEDPDVVNAKPVPCKAWVVAPSEHNDGARPKKNAEDLLEKILKQVRPTHIQFKKVYQTPPTASDDSPDLSRLKQELHALLKNKRRYLLVVDNLLEVQLWDDVKSAFPNTAGSRIIVTTSIQSIANNISRSCDRYAMPYLDITSSRELLQREMGDYGTIRDKERILSKCDGLPLALVSVAKHLNRDPTPSNFGGVAQALGTYIAGTEQAFGELKRTLAQCYGSLPEYRDRRCLLSVSMFPQGHRINRKSLFRRWIAEGLVGREGQLEDVNIASKSFGQIVDRSIIDPVLLTDNTSEVKRCQVRGLMLEFIVHKSTSGTNFLTLVDKDGRLHKQRGSRHARRLSVHGDTRGSASFADEIDVSVIRWLSICSCSSIPFDLSKCTLLRVLDLEDCKGLDVVLASICKLVSLKYLSLRGSDVKEIPKKIKELIKLETLDIRQTDVKKLPMKVIMMPELVHLFGKFEILPNPKGLAQSKKMEKFFKDKSNLQTLAGVVIENMDHQYFNDIMLYARKLKKVKIWCKTTSTYPLVPLEKRFSGEKPLESLSIDSSNQPINILTDGFLCSVSGNCDIRFLKLRGALEGLPDYFAIKLAMVQELQLSSTGLSSQALSSALQKMSCLVYLKLSEDRHSFGDGSFLVQSEGFPSLLRLRIEAPRLPKVQLKKGAMRRLTSLGLLLCPGIPAQNGDTVETTSHQSGIPQTGITPNETRATSEIASPELESPLGIRAAWIKLFHYLGKMTGANSETTAPLETGVTAEIEGRIGVEGLSNLAKLDEVILHHSTTDAVMEDWKEAQKQAVREEAARTNKPQHTINCGGAAGPHIITA